MTTEKQRQLPWGLNPESITPGSMKVTIDYNNIFHAFAHLQGWIQLQNFGWVVGRAKRVRYVWKIVVERSEAAKPAAGEQFWGLTAHKTSRCNLALEISFIPSSQSTFNFGVLRATHAMLLLPFEASELSSLHKMTDIFNVLKLDNQN